MQHSAAALVAQPKKHLSKKAEAEQALSNFFGQGYGRPEKGLKHAYFFPEPPTRNWAAGLKAMVAILEKIFLAAQQRAIRAMKVKFLPYMEKIRKERQQRLTMSMKRWVNREVGAAFRKWHVLFGKEARREKVLKAVMRMQQVQLVAALNTWMLWYSELMEQKQRLKAAMSRFVNQGLAIGYNSWREWYNDVMYQRDLLAKAVARMRNGAMAAAMSTWRAWYEDMVEQRETLNIALKKMLNRALVNGFNTWRWYCEDLYRQRDLAKKIWTKWASRALMEAYNKWRFVQKNDVQSPEEPTTTTRRLPSIASPPPQFNYKIEEEEEIELNLHRNHDFPVGDGSPRKVMSDRSYLARQRTFQVISQAKEYKGIAESRRYIKSAIQDTDTQHYHAARDTELPWTALHSSDQMVCTAQPARNILSEYLLEQPVDCRNPVDTDRAKVRAMQQAAERSHRENKKKFFGKFVHDDFPDFYSWAKRGGDHLNMEEEQEEEATE
eukprot:TRINITY_DN44047_c0_g1_i1.p1 TRINITY_DN44047_c0_g1~~TRINITY_DN44047_c0_g1_i1.p1  ORF type:complete len:494 (-),score=133.60 TRINITY_DN44047_c0_g1_i1:40-1521(-)